MRIGVALKAIAQLGLIPVLQNAIYRIGLLTGYWKYKTPPPSFAGLETVNPRLPVRVPGADELQSIPGFDVEGALLEADEIVQGLVRLFGGPPVSLDLNPHAPDVHWFEFERGRVKPAVEDIKLIWEPARFGWAITLMRASILTGDERYSQAFYTRLQEFELANPPFLGPNWSSGQEAAFRLISIAWPGMAMSPQTSHENRMHLGAVIAVHALRIEPTIIYAKSQRNNHVILEAAGLITAGCFLPEHPRADKWLSTGWKLFHQAIQDQIETDGTYIQHSANYHRLMLQASTWVFALALAAGMSFPSKSLKKLAQATLWLAKRIDPGNGSTPNLGNNDGALLFPIPTCDRDDYRPAVQAASMAFLGKPIFPAGPWDEPATWLGLSTTIAVPNNPSKTKDLAARQDTLAGSSSWASIRAVNYRHRPGQCDQLHVDIWQNGTALTYDAGTYRYNSQSPWDNSLASTAAHNTVQINGKEQMFKAGRFLWLDWAQAKLQKTGSNLIASHNGYRSQGMIHQRTLCLQESDIWLVLDRLLPDHTQGSHQSAVLHWLLPDLPWKLQGTTLFLETASGVVTIQIGLTENSTARTSIQVIRCGKILAGPGTAPQFLGWVSPTYQVLNPALSLRLIVEGALPLSISTTFRLPTANLSKRPN